MSKETDINPFRTIMRRGYTKIASVEIHHEDDTCKCDGLNQRCRFQSVKYVKASPAAPINSKEDV